MAALGDDEKKQQGSVDVKFDLKDPPSWRKEEISGLDEESQKLLNHKCKFTVDENGANLTFKPTPYLYDNDGNYKVGKVPVHKNKDNKDDDDDDDDTDDDDSDDGYHDRALADEEIDIEKVFSIAAGSLDCDEIESTFIDQDKNNCKNTKLIGSRYSRRMRNGFIRACEIAWAEHYPLRIDPSHIWLCITQAVALHVDKNGEKLREKWVMHDGKKVLRVQRDGFVKGFVNVDVFNFVFWLFWLFWVIILVQTFLFIFVFFFFRVLLFLIFSINLYYAI